MDELIKLLDKNKVKYTWDKYGYDYDCIVVKKNKYKMFIYYDNGYVSDLQRIPYSWGEMGSITLSDIINDLKVYLGIDLDRSEENE